ncbi:MAG: adenylate/guanylate cyclase domain-containing protein [Acidimicrobiia bacterium]|nr:adenylate/guanylate cyclase domain-containing protein [Acidimicrobiia bacterium]
MAPHPSPELEAVFVRALRAYAAADIDTLANLMSTDPALRVLGFGVDEWWVGHDEFLKVRDIQRDEIGGIDEIPIDSIETFEDGGFGWGTMFTTVHKADIATPMRTVALFRLEAGSWKVIHWTNSVPVPNQQVFGVDLTTTLDTLIAALLDTHEEIAIDVGAEGTMTLVFTDMVDSTVLAERLGDAAWADVVRRHEMAIRTTTESHGGRVIKLLGDGSMLAFESARGAVRAAVDIQRSVADEPFSVRIGMHTGDIIRTESDVLGVTVNKAARVASAAGPGQIMVSSTTRDLMGAIDGVHAGETRIVTLKGLSDAHQITSLDWT